MVGDNEEVEQRKRDGVVDELVAFWTTSVDQYVLPTSSTGLTQRRAHSWEVAIIAIRLALLQRMETKCKASTLSAPCCSIHTLLHVSWFICSNNLVGAAVGRVKTESRRQTNSKYLLPVANGTSIQ